MIYTKFEYGVDARAVGTSKSCGVTEMSLDVKQYPFRPRSKTHNHKIYVWRYRLLVVKTIYSIKYNENPICYGFFFLTNYTYKKKPSSNLHCSKCADRGSVQYRIEGRRGSEILYVIIKYRPIYTLYLSLPKH